MENPGDYITSVFLVEKKVRLHQDSQGADTIAGSQYQLMDLDSLSLPHNLGILPVSLLDPLCQSCN